MKLLFAIIFTVVCFLAPFSSAQADEGSQERSMFNSMYCFFFSCDTENDQEALDQAWNDYSGYDAESVPELDGAGAPIAAALIVGLLGLGFERRRRKQK